jgi:hypothetical protein
MTSNSSSIVISFSIAILLLLILLLLLSYNSKSKRDNNEQFYNYESLQLPNMIDNPFGNFKSFTDKIATNISEKNKNKEKFDSMASFDPYAKASMINNPNIGIEGNEENNNNYASINGGEGNNNKYTNFKEGFENQATQDPTTCIKKEKLTSKDLLPKDAQNLVWSKINPSSQANIEDQNFLTAGYHIGVNTIGQSLRNANLQLRSEIPNPQVAVSPWLISTIEPDVRSTTLEIGSAPSY